MSGVNEDLVKFSRIFRCTRKLLGASQQSLSDTLETSQSVLSKIESMTTMPSASLIFRLCEVTGIPIESFRTGFIDRFLPSFEKMKSDSTLFKVPTKYLDHNYSTVRSLQPFLRYYEQFENTNFVEYCKSKRIDSDYFVCWDNQLNIKHSVEMIKDMLNTNPDPGVIIEYLALQACEPYNHGHFAEKYLQADHAFDLVRLFVENMNSYDSNFSYKVTDLSSSKLELVVNEGEHIAPMLKNDRDLFLDFSNHYNIKYFGYLSRMLSKQCLNVSMTEDVVGNLRQWQYKLAMAA